MTRLQGPMLEGAAAAPATAQLRRAQLRGVGTMPAGRVGRGRSRTTYRACAGEACLCAGTIAPAHAKQTACGEQNRRKDVGS